MVPAMSELPRKTMSAEEARSYTERVRSWWNAHPFTLGLASSAQGANYDITGRVEDLTPAFFAEVDRKMRKFYGESGQAAGAPLLSALVPYGELAEKSVLDIAVGSGWSTTTLAAQGAKVTGIDLTDEAVRMTKRHLELKNLSADIQRADAQSMPFPDASFDYTLAWGCLMHMPDTEQAIREIFRTLKPAGRTLAYMYNKDSLTYWFSFLFLRGILKGDLIRYRGNATAIVSRYSDGAPVGGNMLTKAYSKREAAQLFAQAGFSAIKVYPFYIPIEAESWPSRSFPIFKYLPAGIKRWMGTHWAWGLIVEAAKPA